MGLEEKIEGAQAIVGVIGLGYVGLPLARVFALANFRTRGFDIDPAKVEKLNRGESYLKTVPAERVRQIRKLGTFEATTDFSRLAECDAIIICVPTPLTPTRDPDLSFVVDSVRAVGRNLRKGQLVVLESTTYPGTTDEVAKPILEETGLVCGKDFFLAFSPEREDPGNRDFHTTIIPKVVGGVDEASGRLAQKLYGKVIEKIVPVSSAKVAEAAKILENVYRCINIALVNELKMVFDRMGIDVWEVIAAAGTKPFGFQAFYPGPGLGGHCIPIDPFYLSWKAREYGCHARFIELAGEINTGMPHYVIGKLTEALNSKGKAVQGSRVLVLGIAYKKDIDDLRESPALELLELLGGMGAEVLYNDPYLPSTPRTRRHDLGLKSQELTPKLLRGVDCVLIATDHSAYDWEKICADAPLIVDTRNATKDVATAKGKVWKA
jgi:UDP-N-acetyl-D-glucosamine dehydrogenase